MREKIKYVAGEIKWQLGRFARWIRDENTAWRILLLLNVALNARLFLEMNLLKVRFLTLIELNEKLFELFQSIFS